MDQRHREKTSRVRETGKLLVSLLLLVSIMLPSAGFSVGLSGELTQAEMAKLANRELIIHSKEASKCPWPEITVFALIDALPVEAAALFSNYQDQKTYVPDLARSTPVTRHGENETIVEFEMRLPWPLSNSRYSTRNVLTKADNNEYQVSWSLVESDCLVDSRGMVKFVPYGEKTLLTYRSLIHPNSRLSSIFGSRAKSGISKTVQAMVSYIEETKRHSPEKIRTLVNALPK